MRIGLALFVASTLACSKESATPPPPAPPCAEIACTTSGVPPEACAEGFKSDGARGCAPILPEEECEENTFAVPGMSTCTPLGVDACAAGFSLKPDGCVHSVPLGCEGNTIALLEKPSCEPIAPCGTDRFPAVTSPAIYVDAAFTGTDSDGGEAKPFARITDALARVDATKRTVAVAAGRYVEALRIDRTVEIVAACEEKTFVVGPKTIEGAAVEILADATLRNIDVMGPHSGIVVAKGTTKISSSRVHNTGADGIIVRPEAVLELDRVVVSVALGAAVSVLSGDATIKNSELRATGLLSDGSGGVGVGASSLTKRAPRVTIERSVLSRNTRYGVFARGAELTVRDSLIAQSSGDKADGAGILASAGLLPPKVVVSGVIIESSTGGGVMAFDGTLEMDRTTIRGTRTALSGGFAMNLNVDPVTRKPVNAKVTRSLIADSEDHGVLVRGAIVDIGGSIIRTTKTGAAEPSGRAVVTERQGSIVPMLTIHDSLIEDAVGSGVTVTSGTTTLDRVHIRGIAPSADKRFGFGAVAYIDTVATRPTLIVRRSLIEGVHEAGLMTFGSRLEVEGTVIRGVAPRAELDFFGHGVHFSYDLPHRTAADGFVRGAFITDVLEAGVNVFMSDVEVDATTIANVAAGAHGLYGDGVTVSSVNKEHHSPATLAVRRSKITAVARAAISVFEADAAVAGLLSSCNRIDLAVETFVGKQETRLTDEGANLCGCESLAECHARTSKIEPIGQ